MRLCSIVGVCVLLAGVSACSDPAGLCLPGETQMCIGPGGCTGGQACAADGTSFSACDCGPNMDAGRRDAGIDAGPFDAGPFDADTSDAGPFDADTFDADTFDAGSSLDAGRLDSGLDAGGPGDAGPAMCSPSCNASERCCGTNCVSRTGTPTGLDGRDDVSFGNCNGCLISCDPSTASACSVLAGTVMPVCACGASGACADPQRCERRGDVFECHCGGRACTSAERCCGGACVSRAVPRGTDGRSDPSFNNCNGCGIACDVTRAGACSIPGVGVPRCMCGLWDQCLPGEACVSEGGRWLCVSTSTDPRNCGMIGNACAEGESCVDGACVCGSTGAACGADQACCAGACADTSSDGMNCGGCDNVCLANAPDCQGGSCTCAMAGRACVEPVPGGIFPPVEGMPGESCCPGVGCVANTDANCACEACTGTDTCVVSGGGLLPGGTVEVCCGDSLSLFPCGGGAFPGLDAGVDGG